MTTTITVQYDSENTFIVHAIEVLKGLGAKISIPQVKKSSEKKYNNEPMEVEPFDMVAETWEGYGLSKEAAESSAESMKEYSRGEYVVCHNKEELDKFFYGLSL